VAGIMSYKMKSRNLTDFKGIFRKMPFTMTALIVVALSVIGVPPTCGFFSKWYLIQGALMAGNWVFVFALLFSSLINVILFFRIIEIGYYSFDYNNESSHSHGHGESVVIDEAPLSMLVPTYIVAAIVVLIGLYNQSIVTNIIQFAVPML